ncbi:DUF4431 domain-containing protein [Nitrospirillum sp. BR 11752]|uniref:DUF4431 domain-containing protein n=1 Tax=Nitrospirillum sp. BR 11752 TaxID=3104293 RepID=UPI002EB9208B|nr:DUF4431 domain-containing protein [Nitrospirillum sp. BR 11752]
MRIIAATIVTIVLIGFQICVAKAQQGGCLNYPPSIVTLTGKISEHSFHTDPGSKYDRLETYWFLDLPHPICTNSNGHENDDLYEGPEKNLARLQLIVDQYPNDSWIGHDVVLTGTLEHAQLGNQHTSVLLRVQTFQLAK